MSKHKVGGVITKKSTGGMYGIPQENLGGSSMKKGGAKPKAMYGQEIMRNGGTTGKRKKYKTKNSYSELTGTGGDPLKTTVDSPSGNYKKNIEWTEYLSDTKKPYVMTVTKGGKTNDFQLSKEQAISQRKKVKKTMGFQKGGTTDSFKKLAPPYNKATYADKIAGAKKNTRKKK